MSQPTAYVPATDFSQEEVAGVAGRERIRTAALDSELAAVQLSVSEILTSIAALQRDDYKLIDRSVELHTLSTEVLALMGSAGFTVNDPIGWLTATSYAARSIVNQGTGTYVCVVAHTSGTFATDLAAGKWVVIFDSASYVASAIAFTPAGGISATNVQAAIAEVDSEAPKKAQNLADLASVATARTNLSVFSKDEAQRGVGNIAVAGGTVDAITVALTPTVSSLVNNLMAIFEAGGANASTTPTLNVDGTGAKTIVRPDGNALFAGDIAGAGARAICFYDLGNDQWVLANPFFASTTTPSQTLSPSQITGDQNDYNPTGLSASQTVRISADARRTITGLATGVSGREITLMNIGEYPIVFSFQNSSSSAANRFAFGHVLSGGHTMKVQYDSTSSRWRCTFKQLPAGTSIDHMGGTLQEGTLAEDGSNVSRTTYAALFREIGTAHGVGDGSTTFGLPDTRRRVLVGSGGTGTGTLGNAVGNTGGAETHTLSTGEQATHAHDILALVGGGTQAAITLNTGPANYATTNGTNAYISSSGGGGAHNNMQPSLVVTRAIIY